MNRLQLFTEDNSIGYFIRMIDRGLEFHAEAILPYQRLFDNIPLYGQFILIRLATPYEAILGRIVSIDHHGPLPSRSTEDQKVLNNSKHMPAGLHTEYKVGIHALGVLYSLGKSKLTFIASQRRYPPPWSAVAFPSASVLQELVGNGGYGAVMGHLALGEYIYATNEKSQQNAHGMHHLVPEIVTRFPVDNLIARRSFILARAGFGKSNLNKLLFSELYKETPTIRSRRHERIPVGTVIFDPDGEYFWPDNKGRPGLCDVPELQQNLVVFTEREAPSDFYQSFVAGNVKLDLRKLKADDVLTVALTAQKQEQQNVRKLKALCPSDWADLIDHIEQGGNTSDLTTIKECLHLQGKQEAEALAARANMTALVQLFHDGSSQFMEILSFALAQGKLCVVDISHMHDDDSLAFTGFILHELFRKNREEFTKRQSTAFPIIAVIEEAQTVLTKRSPAATPHISWVKEGRKYDLGCVLVTQQPGSLPKEVLSQGDNWFVLHLLSKTDLLTLQRANAYFSQDIISLLLNEPIPGHGDFWSSVTGNSYPIPMRVLSFEERYALQDPDYRRGAVETFVHVLPGVFHSMSLLEYAQVG